jgi:hypothetical protein
VAPAASANPDGDAPHFIKQRRRGKAPSSLADLLLALSLSATYYFLVCGVATGKGDNQTNGWVFSACSIPGFHLQDLYDAWKGRLSGLLLSGYLFDFTVKGQTYNADQFPLLFGLYQALWLFALFILVIASLRYSLLINLWVFAGLLYNFSPAAGFYFYPWDIPATIYFTLAALLFQQDRPSLMVVAICAGCFFKETVLVCALLVLFATRWTWPKRLLGFTGMFAVYLVGKKLLTTYIGIRVAPLSIADATNLQTLLQTGVAASNIKTILSPTLNHVAFTNAGSLVLVLALGWRKRFLPYMVVILAFVIGQFFYAAWIEFRTFMQILPLSVILLTERWREALEPAPQSPGEQPAPSSAGGTPAPGRPSARLRGALAAAKQMLRTQAPGQHETTVPGSPWRTSVQPFFVVAILLIILPTLLAAWRYCVVAASIKTQRGGHPENGSHHLTAVGKSAELAMRSQIMREAYERDELELAAFAESKQQIPDAVARYQHVIEINTNSLTALRNLAWLRATAADPQWRNGPEAVRLAERACQLDSYSHATPTGVLAAAYAEAGRFDEAARTAEKAHALAVQHNQPETAATTAQMAQLFRSGRPYHQPQGGSAAPQ